MPMNFSLRPAVQEDVAAVKTCVIAAFEHYVERIGNAPAPMLLDFAAEIQAKRVWVAENGAQIIGALIQYETESGFYIDTVAVAPSAQGIGVGKTLLQLAEGEAVRRGYKSIYLCTNSKMTENQVLYPRIGYVEYDRTREAGYDRVFYIKYLAEAQPPSAA